jgi:hypothetical protein
MSELDVTKKLAEDSRALARDVMTAAVSKKPVKLEGHVSLFLARATTSMESVEVLATVGLSADATSVSRTIFEVAIDLVFILKEDTEERFRLFFAHEFVREWLEVQAIERLHGTLPEASKEAMKVIKARYDQVKDAYKENEYQWCGSLKSRARAIGVLHLYDLAYTEGCAMSHSTPRALRNNYSNTGEKITIKAGPQKPSSRPIRLALMGFIPLIADVINFCGLQDQFDPRHDALVARMNALPPTESEEDYP